MTTFVFSTQFYPDEKNARPTLSVGSFWVILVGNGMFHYFPHSYTLILYNLTSYARGRPMEGAILIFFYCDGDSV